VPVAFFEFLLFSAVLIVGVTQVLWPIWRGTPLFPWVHARYERELLKEAERERQRQIEMQLTHDLTRQTLRETDLIEERTEHVFKPERKAKQ
jgi:hypothetical protein